MSIIKVLFIIIFLKSEPSRIACHIMNIIAKLKQKNPVLMPDFFILRLQKIFQSADFLDFQPFRNMSIHIKSKTNAGVSKDF